VTDGHCSVCYKKMVKNKQQPPAGSLNLKVPSPQQRATPTPTSSTTSPEPNIISLLQQPQQQSQPPIINTDNEVIIATTTDKVSITATISTDNAIAEASSSSSASVTLSSPTTTESLDNSPSADSKKKSNRCLMCRKKVGLTGFECRCGGLFCSTHRYSDKHECTFDYRQHGAEQIRKNNPIVVSEKITKI